MALSARSAESNVEDPTIVRHNVLERSHARSVLHQCIAHKPLSTLRMASRISRITGEITLICPSRYVKYRATAVGCAPCGYPGSLMKPGHVQFIFDVATQKEVTVRWSNVLS